MDRSSTGDQVSRSGFRAIDAHGHAALILVESLLHSLVERSVISLDEAVDIVAVAIDATEAIADDQSDRSAELDQSISLLTAISRSLKPILQGVE